MYNVVLFYIEKQGESTHKLYVSFSLILTFNIQRIILSKNNFEFNYNFSNITLVQPAHLYNIWYLVLGIFKLTKIFTCISF